MPIIIKNIDQFSFEDKEDKIFISFQDVTNYDEDNKNPLSYNVNKTRKCFLEYMDTNNISYIECGPSSESGWMEGYSGWVGCSSIYMDKLLSYDGFEEQQISLYNQTYEKAMASWPLEMDSWE